MILTLITSPQHLTLPTIVILIIDQICYNIPMFIYSNPECSDHWWVVSVSHDQCQCQHGHDQGLMWQVAKLAYHHSLQCTWADITSTYSACTAPGPLSQSSPQFRHIGFEGNKMSEAGRQFYVRTYIAPYRQTGNVGLKISYIYRQFVQPSLDLQPLNQWTLHYDSPALQLHSVIVAIQKAEFNTQYPQYFQ